MLLHFVNTFKLVYNLKKGLNNLVFLSFQDLISVDLDESMHTGDMINLGPVKTRLVCSPDWETMLTKSIA
jgi:hypothetical protein